MVKLLASGFDLIQFIGEPVEFGSNGHTRVQTGVRFTTQRSIVWGAGRTFANHSEPQALTTDFYTLQMAIVQNSLMTQSGEILLFWQVGQPQQELTGFSFVPTNQRNPVQVLALAGLSE